MRICTGFGDEYWLQRDHDGVFPADFHQALARDGWLGICMPEEYGGGWLGITEAAIMMQTIAQSGAGMTGASAVHMNIFGLNPVVVFGDEAPALNDIHVAPAQAWPVPSGRWPGVRASLVQVRPLPVGVPDRMGPEGKDSRGACSLFKDLRKTDRSGHWEGEGPAPPAADQ